MTEPQLIGLVKGYLKEACEPLNIVPDTIKFQNNIFPLIPFYNPNNDCIEINPQSLNFLIQNKKPTVIRMAIYKSVYIYYQKVQGISENDMELEADAYCLALGTVLGLHLLDEVIPGKDMNDLWKRVFRLLKEIFQVDCCIQSVSCQKGNTRHNRKIIALTRKARKEYEAWMNRKKLAPLINDLTEEELGSQNNPFPTIEAAKRFVKEEERKAYLADDFLRQRIEREPFVFDGIQFKVEWASPFVAHQANNFPTDAFIVNEVHRKGEFGFRYSLKPNLYQRKFLYRGQSQFFSPCKPNLFRSKKSNYLEDLIWGNEMTLLVKSHPLVRLFEHGIDLLHDNFRFSVNYGGLQQHYYNKTSFLDLTSNIDAACFFAVSDYDAVKDEYTMHRDDGKLGVLYYYDLEMPGAFHPQFDGTHLSVIGKQVFMRSGQQHGFLFQVPKDADFNTLPHVHKVFFRHDDTVTQRIFEKAMQGKKYFPDDLLESHWKKYNVIYKERKEVSLGAVKENLKFNKNETVNSLTRQLNDLGYHVEKNLSTSFDKDELHAYYQDIRNGFWSEFCHDIYFLGPENDFYREMLLQAENNPNYREFFIEQS